MTMETSFKLTDIRKTLDYVQDQGANKVKIRPTAPHGLCSSIEFEFTGPGKIAATVSLQANGKMTRVLVEEVK